MRARKGERYSGWLLLGFLPVHLGCPFPALRAAGILPDSWATQYAVLIGSAIEIPLLLSILHRHAKDFSENHARLRALVVAASRLSTVVRDVDTVCRVADTRFVILSEGPQADAGRRLLAQHIVARGLEQVYPLPPDLSLRFRVVSTCAPDGAIEVTPEGDVDEQRPMQRMNQALDQLSGDPRKVVHHLEPKAPAGPPAARPAWRPQRIRAWSR